MTLSKQRALVLFLTVFFSIAVNASTVYVNIEFDGLTNNSKTYQENGFIFTSDYFQGLQKNTHINDTRLRISGNYAHALTITKADASNFDFINMLIEFSSDRGEPWRINNQNQSGLTFTGEGILSLPPSLSNVQSIEIYNVNGASSEYLIMDSFSFSYEQSLNPIPVPPSLILMLSGLFGIFTISRKNMFNIK